MIFLMIGVLLLLTLWLVFNVLFRKKNKKSVKMIPEKSKPILKECPLCGSKLEGSKLYSKQTEYPGGRKILEISGCQVCRSGEKERKCPSCKRVLSPGDVVVADYEKRGSVNRVIIKGCGKCYSPPPPLYSLRS